MCSAHGAVRILLGEIVGSEKRPTVVDIEAGLEHLSRGTARNVDTLLAVFEPYFKSMETAARMSELGRELGIARVLGVANKVSSADEERELREFCAGKGLEVIAVIPQDPSVREAERAGVGPLDVTQSSPAIDRIGELARTLTS
ncbi:MAG: hypothetical protein NVSMB68_04000 [Thermoanaerobaculia bacterium]